jgi:outer membrane autotransporter protein
MCCAVCANANLKEHEKRDAIAAVNAERASLGLENVAISLDHDFYTQILNQQKIVAEIRGWREGQIDALNKARLEVGLDRMDIPLGSNFENTIAKENEIIKTEFRDRQRQVGAANAIRAEVGLDPINVLLNSISFRDDVRHKTKEAKKKRKRRQKKINALNADRAAAGLKPVDIPLRGKTRDFDKRIKEELRELKEFCMLAEREYQNGADFVSNVKLLGYMLDNTTRNDLYDRIYAGREKGVWAQVQGSQIKLDSNEKNKDIGNFKVNNGGVTAGFDAMPREDVMVGVFINNNNVSIDEESEQKSSAQVNRTGVGVYGGLFKERTDVKVAIGGSFNQYETNREQREAKMKGEFMGVSGNVDIESGYTIPLGRNGIKVRPYVGGAGFIAYTQRFKEEGEYALDVKKDNYCKMSGRMGIGLLRGDEKKRFRWSSSLGVEYLLAGMKYEVMTTRENNGEQVVGNSLELDKLIVEGNIGAGYKVTEKIEIYMQGKVSGAKRYQNLYGQVGVRYVFGKKAEQKSRDGSLESDKQASK